jgi:hypothetical protein
MKICFPITLKSIIHNFHTSPIEEKCNLKITKSKIFRECSSKIAVHDSVKKWSDRTELAKTKSFGINVDIAPIGNASKNHKLYYLVNATINQPSHH